jgi:plastocyanin
MKRNTDKLIYMGGMFAILAIVLISCGGGGSMNSSGFSGTTSGSGGTTMMASTVAVVPCPTSGTTDVSIVSMAAGFNPGGITVPLNTTVKWTNIDAIEHTVTSTTVPSNGDFNVPVSPGTSVCLKFTSAGTFNYHCSIHPTTMIGSVVVQ